MKRMRSDVLLSFLSMIAVALVACAERHTDSTSTLLEQPIAAVLTTDIGAEMDDQWTLAHLLLSPEIDLRAIVTTHAAPANLSSLASAQKATEVIERVLSAVGDTHPPVEPGSTSPLVDATTPRDSSGVDLLLEISKEFSPSQRLVVFATGAATDVASAILKDPSIIDRITVVAMAFNDWPAGGDLFNVRNDPQAWNVILESDVPVVVGSFAVTGRTLRLTREEGAVLMKSRGPIGEYLFSELVDWLDRQSELVATAVAPDTWVIWDQVVVAYVLGMASGEEVPRPILNQDLSFSHEETVRRITWLTDIDADRVWNDFAAKIDAIRLR